MDIDRKDNDILQLLNKLKETNGTYPQDLLAARRQGYLKQVAEVGAGAGLALALKHTTRAGKATGTALTSAAGKLLEAILVVAIVAEASALAYFYRDELVEIFQRVTGSQQVEDISNLPVLSSPIPTIELTLSPVVAETETPIGTPSFVAGQPTDQSGSAGAIQAVSTQDPDKSGNQYGLTPKPERTVKPGSNDGTDKQTDQGNPDKKP